MSKSIKNFLLFTLCCLGIGWSASVDAQTDHSSGVITYHKVYPGIPGFLEETLTFSGAESVQRVKRDKQVHELSNGYRITHPAKDERMYLNQHSGIIVRQQYDRKKKDYVLWDYEAPAYNWELRDEFRTIGEYKCQKATVTYNEPGWGVATAWFTEDVPLSVGPERTYGLPGLIVEMGFENNWDAKYILKEIRYEPVTVAPPTEGISISEGDDGKRKKRKKALRDALSQDGE